MLLIALMLTGCGQIKNFIHPETKDHSNHCWNVACWKPCLALL